MRRVVIFNGVNHASSYQDRPRHHHPRSALEASDAYDCQYGSDFQAGPSGAQYTTCRGNAASIDAAGEVVLSGTRHGIASAVSSLSALTGLDIWALAKAGTVVRYDTTMPTWAWYETLDEAAARGDRAAVREKAYRDAVQAWRDACPQGINVALAFDASRILALPPALRARALDTCGAAMRRHCLAVLSWQASEPRR